MGYSYRDDAGKVLDGWTQECRRQTGQSNVFRLDRASYFFEEDRVEYEDGGITGEVFLQLTDSRCRSVGKFRVSGEGVLVEAPEAIRKAFKEKKTA